MEVWHLNVLNYNLHSDVYWAVCVNNEFHENSSSTTVPNSNVWLQNSLIQFQNSFCLITWFSVAITFTGHLLLNWLLCLCYKCHFLYNYYCYVLDSSWNHGQSGSGCPRIQSLDQSVKGLQSWWYCSYRSATDDKTGLQLCATELYAVLSRQSYGWQTAIIRRAIYSWVVQGTCDERLRQNCVLSERCWVWLVLWYFSTNALFACTICLQLLRGSRVGLPIIFSRCNLSIMGEAYFFIL